MSERIGQYKHLDRSTPVVIEGTEGSSISVPVSSFVRSALQTNYGLHRLLSEIVIQVGVDNEVKSKKYDVHSKIELVEQIRTFLNKGGF